jgi:hypothetical protein
MPTTPTPVPADVLSRLVALFARMQARGMLEKVDIYGRVTEVDPTTFKPVARPLRLLGTLDAMVDSSGGATNPTNQERAVRQADTHTIFFVRSDETVALLSEETFADRIVVLKQRDTRHRRFTFLQAVGPYYYGSLTAGGTGDAAGG